MDSPFLASATDADVVVPGSVVQAGFPAVGLYWILHSVLLVLLAVFS